MWIPTSSTITTGADIICPAGMAPRSVEIKNSEQSNNVATFSLGFCYLGFTRNQWKTFFKEASTEIELLNHKSSMLSYINHIVAEIGVVLSFKFLTLSGTFNTIKTLIVATLLGIKTKHHGTVVKLNLFVQNKKTIVGFVN